MIPPTIQPLPMPFGSSVRDACIMDGFVLGTAQLGLAYGIANRIGKPTAEIAQRIVDGAIAEGIRFFDTAQAYGDSEAVLGATLARQVAGTEPQVITKLHPEVNIHRRDEVVARVRASRERLAVGSLWGLLLHREELLDAFDGTLESALLELKAEGVVRHVGISVYQPARAWQALNCHAIDTIQVPANVFDRRMHRAGVFSRAAEIGKSVFVRSAYLQGLALLPSAAVPRHIPSAPEAVAAFERFCRDSGIDRSGFALGYVRQLACDARLVVGAETPEQLAVNCQLYRGSGFTRELGDAWTAVWPDDREGLIDPSSWRFTP